MKVKIGQLEIIVENMRELDQLVERYGTKESKTTTDVLVASGNNGTATPIATTLPANAERLGREGSLRATVLREIEKTWLNADDIATRSALAIQQVRGVINAPGVAGRIQRRTGPSGKMEYCLRPDETESEDAE